jgi:hypothetical protein
MVKLELSGVAEIPAQRGLVWEHLIDPRFVARSAPGVEMVELIDSTHFRMTCGVGVGSFRASMTLDGEMFDFVPGSSAKMLVRGRGPGSIILVCTSIGLHERSPGVVQLNWMAITELSGTIAKAGRRLIDGVARRLTQHFWDDFARRVAADSAGQLSSTSNSIR